MRPAQAITTRNSQDLAIATGIVGGSEAVVRVRSLIVRLAPMKIPVFIEGPTGSGKELVARALHSLSGRSGPFVAANVCAISEAMFESTLFGHVRGAFTGALESAPGYLAEAHAGTLFLDEISGLSLGMQVKLLRAVETRVFRPVGARQDAASDFRLITASNERLVDLVASGRMRADLAHRIDTAVVHVPPLAERREDIAALISNLITDITPNPVTFSEGALRRLCLHPWPGNVRELRNVLERVVAFASGSSITADDVAAHLSGAYRVTAPEDTEERAQLLSLLTNCEWEVETAARHLGVHRATIYRQMRRLEIRTPRIVVDEDRPTERRSGPQLA